MPPPAASGSITLLAGGSETSLSLPLSRRHRSFQPPPQEYHAGSGKGSCNDVRSDIAREVEGRRKHHKHERQPQDHQRQAQLQEEHFQSTSRMVVVSCPGVAANPTTVFAATAAPSLAQEEEVLSSLRKQKLLKEKVLGSKRLRSPVLPILVKSPGVRMMLLQRISSPSMMLPIAAGSQQGYGEIWD